MTENNRVGLTNTEWDILMVAFKDGFVTIPRKANRARNVLRDLGHLKIVHNIGSACQCEIMESGQLMVLTNALLQSWDALTAYKNQWDINIPSLNQCAVTALVVQDYFGGMLLSCPTSEGSSHYWNRLSSGEDADLTESQFDFIADIPLKDKAQVRTREAALYDPDLYQRYTVLSERVKRIINSWVIR